MTTESMPPLPHPMFKVDTGESLADIDAWVKEQMHAYAQAYAAQEVAKERWACANVCDEYIPFAETENENRLLERCIKSIRSRP